MVDVSAPPTLRRSGGPFRGRAGGWDGSGDHPFVAPADVGQQLEPLTEERQSDEEPKHRPGQVDVFGGPSERSNTLVADARIVD